MLWCAAKIYLDQLPHLISSRWRDGGDRGQKFLFRKMPQKSRSLLLYDISIHPPHPLVKSVQKISLWRHDNTTAEWSAAVVSTSRFLCICLSMCLLSPLFGLWLINVLIHLTQQVCVGYKTLTLRECPGGFPLICQKLTNSQGQCLNTFVPMILSKL